MHIQSKNCHPHSPEGPLWRWSKTVGQKLALLQAFLFCLSASANGQIPNFVPWPAQISEQGSDFVYNGSSKIYYETRNGVARTIEGSLQPLANVLAGELEMVTGIRPQVLRKTPSNQPGNNDIDLGFNSIGGNFAATEAEEDQTYTFNSSSGGIAIRSRYTKGVAYGTSTLLQAITDNSGSYRVPGLLITDSPVAEYRSIMLDLGRATISSDVIKDVIRLARSYKIRYVQLHLTEDQRFTFPFAPVINGLAANGVTNFSYGRQELIDVVRYADERGVTLIPEIELPGHSTKLKQSGYLSPFDNNDREIANPANFTKINNMIDDVLTVFPNSPYFHMGGDESGAGSALEPLAASINEHLRGSPPGGKRRLIIWEGFGGSPTAEIPATGDDRVLVMAWESTYNAPWNLLQSGYEVINASWKPTYVVGALGNLKFNLEDIYAWDKDSFSHWERGRPLFDDRGPNDPDLTDSTWEASYINRQNQVIGGSMQLWEITEQAFVERLRSRTAVLSERLWNPNDAKSYNEFRTRWLAIDERSMTTVQPVAILPYEDEYAGDTDPRHPARDLMASPTLAKTQVTMVNRTKIPGVIRYEKSSASTYLDPRSASSVTSSSTQYTGVIDARDGGTFRAKLFGNNGTVIDGDTWQRVGKFSPNRVRYVEYDPKAKDTPRPIPYMANYTQQPVLREFDLPILLGFSSERGFRLQQMDSILTAPGTGTYTITYRIYHGGTNIYLDLNQDGSWQNNEVLARNTPGIDERFAIDVDLVAGQQYWFRVDHASGQPNRRFSIGLSGPGISSSNVVNSQPMENFLSLPPAGDRGPDDRTSFFGGESANAESGSIRASNSNTTAASGSATWSGGRTPPLWRDRTSALGVYSADEDNFGPDNDYLRLKTTISGLAPGASYNVSLDYAAKQNWAILAGLSQSSLQGFAATNQKIGPNDHIGTDDASARVTETGGSTGNTPLLRAALGRTTANARGEIEVFIDDASNSGISPVDRHRAWYRGVSYQRIAGGNGGVSTFVSPSPANNASLAAGSNISFRVNAPGGTRNVRLFRNGTLVRQDASAPYQWNASGQNDPLLRDLQPGSYLFRADVTSGSGDVSSITRSITVIALPTVGDPNSGSLIASSANTTTASGDSNWFGGRTPPLWRDRSADLGVYSADEDTGEYATIKTTVSGLTPGASYKMTLDYGARQSWGILAGLSESSLEGFAASNVQIGSNSHIGLDDASGRVTDSGDLAGNVPLLKGELGVAVADSAGQIVVYIDDSDNGTSGSPDSNRAWYRGVSYEITSGSGSGSGIDPVEVLASIANTTTAGGDATWSGGRTPPLWRDRSSNLGVFSADEDRFGTNNDFLRIKTTLSGLAPGGSYRIALDYGAKQTWGILAGLSESSLQGFAAANVQIGSNAHIGLDDASGRVTDSGNLAGDVPIYKADLGIAVANSAGQIAVYIDDADNGGSGNPDLNRAWYRGLTYQSVSGGGNTGGGNTGGGNTGGGSAGSPNFTQTRVNSVSNQSWTNVDLGQSYSSAVIVASPIYANNSTPPVVARVRNVSGSGFQVKLDRADGQTGAVNLDVSIIAVEEGVYTQAADGVKMEAVKYTSSVTAGKGSWTSDSRSYQNSYTTPVVVGQVMSANDADWSVFWSRGATRASAPDSGNLNVGKQVASDPDRTRANETIGYIVIESGSGNIAGRGYSAGLGSDTVRGVVNSSTGYSYNVSGLSSASAAAVSISGIDGGDGGWAVLFGATAIRANGLTLAVDEDQLGDSERRHTTEQVGYLILE